MKSTNFIHDAFRFLLAGGLNTILSYLAFLFFLLFTTYQISYALSWVFGIIFIAAFYPSKVFVGSDKSWRKTFIFVAQYVVIFFVGLYCIILLTTKFIVDEKISALITMVITAALNFLLGRFLFRGKLLKE